MIVIDNNKKIRLKIKFVGTLFCLSDLCTWHYDKKNAPHFFYLEKFFFNRKSMYSFAKGKLTVNFSFIQRSLKRLSVEE